MIQFNPPTRIAFISSYPSGVCPVALFTLHLVECMIPASCGAFEPVMISVRPDNSRDCSEGVDFVIRRDLRSDYMEAADFINSGNGDVVMLQHHLDLFGEDSGACIAELVRKVHVPVLTTVHRVPENPPPAYFQSLVDVCTVSPRVLVINGHDLEVLNKQYAVPLHKIDLLVQVYPDSPLDQQMKWFHAGRQYWQLIRDLLNRSGRCAQIP
jgi:hypothetical protein